MGYDYGSSAHYEATVNANRVRIYDFGQGAFFDYAVQ